MSSHRTRDLAPTSQSLRRLTFYPNAVPFVAMAPLTALALTQIQLHSRAAFRSRPLHYGHTGLSLHPSQVVHGDFDRPHVLLCKITAGRCQQMVSP